jgi:tRNA splicing ligase
VEGIIIMAKANYTTLKFVAENYGEMGSKRLAKKFKTTSAVVSNWRRNLIKRGLEIPKHSQSNVFDEFVVQYKKEKRI